MLNATLKSIIIVFSIYFFIACDLRPVVGSNDVTVLPGAVFTVTETDCTSTKLQAWGTVTNNSGSTYYPVWYIEADFYSDENFTIKFGGENERMPYSLAPGETTLWELVFSSSSIVESEYPDFGIKNFRAYIN